MSRSFTPTMSAPSWWEDQFDDGELTPRRRQAERFDDMGSSRVAGRSGTSRKRRSGGHHRRRSGR